MLGKDPIPGGPTGNGDIDDSEFLPEEVWFADLVGIALEIFDPFVQGAGLKLRGLSVKEAEVAGHDELVDEVDPDPGLSGIVRVHGYHTGCELRISIFEELEDDVRIVNGSPVVGDGGDETSGIESCRRARGSEGPGWGKRVSIETRDGEKDLSDQA